MKKIIAADHSDTICTNKAIATKEQAKKFAKGVKKAFEDAELECGEVEEFLKGKRDNFSCVP